MQRFNFKYIGFDDRKMILVGVPLISLITPLLFFGLGLFEYLKIVNWEYFESFIYTTCYWLSTRYVMIAFRKKYPSSADLWKRIKLIIGVVILLGPIISMVITVVFKGFYGMTGIPDKFEPGLARALGATYFLQFAVISLYEAIYFFYKYKEAILEKEKIQRAHVQGQLDNLRNQINPHFLFNSLNTLMNLIPTDSDRAMNYLSKLSKFYRYAVSKSEEPLVALETELENVSIYAALLKERFHNGIEITLLKDEIPNAQILPLCLQLLIENAVKHNIVSSKKPLHVNLSLSEDETYICVENNIQRKIQDVASTGMGLKNIRSRIAFFTDKPLIVEENEERFKVSVPLDFTKDLL